MSQREWRPIVTVDAVLLTTDSETLRVLLHRRGSAPFEGAWALPGGYVRPEEDGSTADAVSRVLLQKAGLSGVYLEQLRTYSGPDRDPRDWSVSVSYLGLVPRDRLPEALEDGVALFGVDDLPPLPFDHTDQVRDAVARLRGKGAYSSLPAAFLGDSFTLPELQAAYEVSLGEALDQSSFRRKITALNMIEETGETTQCGSKRPAKLYRLTEPARTFNRTLGAS